MAVAGFCRGCGQYVWIDEQWGCANGHPWTDISSWYDAQTGTPVTPHWLQPTPAAAPAPKPDAATLASTSDIPAPSSRLALLGDIFATLAADPAYRAQYGTDTDLVVQSAAGPGFSAWMKAVESEATLYYAEQLEPSEGPWGYTATRRIVEDIAIRHGWAVKLVLRREDATW